jgi:hypothetical protein
MKKCAMFFEQSITCQWQIGVVRRENLFQVNIRQSQHLSLLPDFRNNEFRSKLECCPKKSCKKLKNQTFDLGICGKITSRQIRERRIPLRSMVLL